MGRHTTYKVTLTQEERNELDGIASKGRNTARKVLFARALLLLDEGDFSLGPWTVGNAASALGFTSRTLEHLKKRFVEDGLDAALERKERETPPRAIKFDGRFEAEVTRIACSAPPEGHTRWSIRLIRDHLIEAAFVDTVSAMTICNILKKTKSNPT